MKSQVIIKCEKNKFHSDLKGRIGYIDGYVVLANIAYAIVISNRKFLFVEPWELEEINDTIRGEYERGEIET